MPAKKKPTKKATAKKATKTTDFDDALELPAAKTVVAIEPMEATMEDALDETAGEAWPNYSPFPEEETEGPGFSPANTRPSATEVDSVFDRLIAQAPETPPKEDSPVLGSGSPVEPLESLSGLNVPQDASKTVTDLIDACNYLYAMARTIRGPRGLKQHDEGILKKRVAKGRELLAGLK